jgi:hypothetical protein
MGRLLREYRFGFKKKVAGLTLSSALSCPVKPPKGRPAMDVKISTLLNATQRLEGFVYEHTRLVRVPGGMCIEVDVREHKQRAAKCSKCQCAAPGYDHLGWRSVFQAVAWVVDWGLAHRTLDGITGIGIDAFLHFWSYRSPRCASEFLRAWVTRAKRSRIPSMRKFAETLQRHEPMLLNWIQARDEIMTGAVEGLNNKCRVVTRRAYGYRSFAVLETMLYHTLGKLPMPELTHRF